MCYIVRSRHSPTTGTISLTTAELGPIWTLLGCFADMCVMFARMLQLEWTPPWKSYSRCLFRLLSAISSIWGHAAVFLCMELFREPRWILDPPSRISPSCHIAFARGSCCARSLRPYLVFIGTNPCFLLPSVCRLFPSSLTSS